MIRQILVSIAMSALAGAAAPAKPGAPLATAAKTPMAALNALLATERALNDAAAKLSPAEGIAALIAEDGTLLTRPAPAVGPQAALKALQANPANAGNFAKWRAIRGGISADGLHGFTYGHLDIEGGAASTAHRRYLSYWVRGNDGWRVVAMKQIARPAAEPFAVQDPTLPIRLVNPSPERSAGHARSMIAADKAFSDRAQQVGPHQAFKEFRDRDAVQFYGPPRPAAASRQTPGSAEPPPPTVHWQADRAIAASSGDLGVTMGSVRTEGPNKRPPEAYFTIWRRDGPLQPWKYIAE